MQSTEWMIIDGNNVLHHDNSLWKNKSFDGSRWELARKTEKLTGIVADHITLVFDGTVGGKAGNVADGAFEVIFADSTIVADTVIEKMVINSFHPERIVVVTSDIMERDTVSAAGASTMSCGNFLDLIRNPPAPFNPQPNRNRFSGSHLGDFFPS